MINSPIRVALFVGAAITFSQPLLAASCCGGGSSSALIMPKFSKGMVDVSFSAENYDGYWNSAGQYTEDPEGSDLNQYRLSFGYAHRLGERWQGSVITPYVWNDNQYSGVSSSTEGMGDTTLNLWYEGFDNIKCVWKIKKPEDWIPASYYGLSMTLPTGISPYDDVQNSFDITGRGFYRLDANLLLDKTIYPWNATLALSYGKYLERPVNREYGRYVEPYDKQLGDRFSGSISGGYTQFLDNMDTLTYTLAYAYLQEEQGTINGAVDTTTGMNKQTLSTTLAYASMDRDWVFKLTLSHTPRRDGYGESFPVTNVITAGVSHVLR